ncbi:hypothetical protein [Ferrovibrio sp.]|uniref:hypothetical protein n=1 Tax=Ferrovibrio sp. TaxID=1917215 RepID=UPI00311DE132
MRPLLLLLVLAGLAGCSGLEDSVRDLNRNLYRSWAGDGDRQARGSGTTAGDGTAAETACFNADSGLLYTSRTGRCAPGYVPIGLDAAEREFGAAGNRAPVAGRAAPEIAPLLGSDVRPARAGGTPTATTGMTAPERRLALCYNDTTGQIFEAEACPPGSRWIDSADAAALQRANLGSALWCYFPGRRLLYRSRACRPGDQALTLAEADRIWDDLPPERRTRTRPSATASNLQPVPPVDAAPRGGVKATPLPAPK